MKVVDGELLDNDFPFDYPPWAARNTWKLDSEQVRRAALYHPALTPETKQPQTTRTAPVQYWTPPGHNSWVGDVATLFHQGRYHVFYLYDRRHHASKFGCGAHYFEHMPTTDFKTWTEHEAATPREEQWECMGTGTPFDFNNPLHLSYGLHTTRVYPQEKTTLPAQWDHLNQHGRTGRFNRATTPGMPAGSTYAVSADGVSNFNQSHRLFHPFDFYDGSNVPSISEITGGRFLMASWIPIRGWGGNLIIRELVQFPDGRIGSKWMEAIAPETQKPRTLAARVAETTTFPADSTSFMLVFQVQPAEARKGKFGLSFLPENGAQASCELQIHLDDRRAQFGRGSLNGFAGKEKSLREGGAPHHAGNYAVENLIGVDRPFTVRVIVKRGD